MGQCISKHTADDGDGADASGNPTVEHPDVPSLSSPTMAPTMSTSTIGNACGNTSTKADAKGKFRFGVFVRGNSVNKEIYFEKKMLYL